MGGGQDGQGDKRKKMKMCRGGILPAYLQPTPPSMEEPSTPPTSLRGPFLFPVGSSNSPPLSSPTNLQGTRNSIGANSAPAGGPFTPRNTITAGAESSIAANSARAGGSLEAGNTITARGSNVATNSTPTGGYLAAGNTNVVGGSTAVPACSTPTGCFPTTTNTTVAEGSTIAVNSAPAGGSIAATSTSVTRGTNSAPRPRAPRRRTTSDAPKADDGRYIVVLSWDYRIIDNHIASEVSNIFEEYPQAVAFTYRFIPKAVLEKYWEEFQGRCVWNLATYSNAVMKKAFLDKLKDRYKGILQQVRKAETQPAWCPDDVYEAWTRQWASPEFKRKSEIAKKARGGKDGIFKGTHTGGSSSHAKTAQNLEKATGQPITPDQLFLWTHTHNHDGITFVNDRSKDIQTQYESLNDDDHDTVGQVMQAIDELERFYSAAGGVNRGRKIFGLGSATAQFYERNFQPRNRGASSSSSSVNRDAENSEERITFQTLQDRLDTFNSWRVDFIAHLDRVEARQQHMEQTNSDGIHLSVEGNEVRDLRERMTDVETQLGPALRGIQSSINELRADVEEMKNASHSGPAP